MKLITGINMKLNIISSGTWFKISNYLNYNFNKISVAAGKLKNIKLVSFKGVYRSDTELKTIQENVIPGDYAFVIVDSNNSFKVYYVNDNIEWVTDDGVYDPEVILGDYILMTSISNVERDLAGDIKDYNNNKN